MYAAEYWVIKQNAFLTADCGKKCWKPISMCKDHDIVPHLRAISPFLSPVFIHSFIHSIKNIRCLLCAKYPTQGYGDTNVGFDLLLCSSSRFVLIYRAYSRPLVNCGFH